MVTTQKTEKNVRHGDGPLALAVATRLGVVMLSVMIMVMIMVMVRLVPVLVIVLNVVISAR